MTVVQGNTVVWMWGHCGVYSLHFTHDNDVAWMSQHLSLKLPINQLFSNNIFKHTTRKTPKLNITGPLWREPIAIRLIPAPKRPEMEKEFPYHCTIMEKRIPSSRAQQCGKSIDVISFYSICNQHRFILQMSSVASVELAMPDKLSEDQKNRGHI